MQSYQLPDDTNPNETGSGKRSLRVTENFDLDANREEDLQGGPLLLSIGRRFEGQETDCPDPQDDPTRPLSGSARAGASADLELPLPEMHHADYAETTAISESSRGKSFSVPTDDALSAGQQNHGLLDVSLLSGMGDFSGRHPNKHTIGNLDIIISELPTVNPNSRSDALAVLPWHFEFSWSAGQLLYGSDPLTSRAFDALPRNRSTRTGNATVAGHLTHGSDSNFSDNEQSAHISTRCSNAGEPGTLDHPADSRWCAIDKALRQGVIDEAWHEFRKRVIEIVDDHFWRTHAPRRSNKEAGKSVQSNSNSATKRSNDNRVTKPRGSRTSQRQKGNIDEGEDGNSEDDQQRDPALPESKSDHDKRRVCCPFFKNDPVRFDSGVSRPSKVLFLNHEALAHVKMRATRESGPRDERIAKQWLHLYKIIFPDATAPFPDPFVVSPEVVAARRIAKQLLRFFQQNRALLWSSFAEFLPHETFATLAEQKRQTDLAVEKWSVLTSDALVEQWGYGDFELDILPTRDLSEAKDGEPTTRNTLPRLESNQQRIGADFLAALRSPSPIPSTLHTLGLGPDDGNTNAVNQNMTFPINTFPDDVGWDDTLLLHDDFYRFEIDDDATKRVDQHGDSSPGKHTGLLPSSSNTISNGAIVPWYPGVGHSMEDGTLSLSLLFGQVSERDDFNQGFHDQDYYQG
ncbi:hypothetical protein PFICI_12868 [Pestalotiopsis fici W106-1]|uniref:Uncharacterized protein n=1 Tax=Pestalotiopsis fici (strain W106-1 / CGMCC3.15140) TaxID=1229662 RepID=W3WQ44_PESFW|nr:uncharacterized protein PFICI_12868 [Pestalotiopsis fici W106-1]ETS75924.1 hypothetical protein PFICI_12868 [Pestalotiopsis fici W106-1]